VRLSPSPYAHVYGKIIPYQKVWEGMAMERESHNSMHETLPTIRIRMESALYLQ